MNEYGYGHWWLVIVNIVLFSLFLLFIHYNPFKGKKVKPSAKSSAIYLSFITALYAEMYGFPFTIYILAWLFGYQNPLTHDAGHLLPGISHGTVGHTITQLMIVGGILLIVLGWMQIHRAKGRLVTDGLYKFVRHPQYLGILLLTSGLLVQWVTIPTAVMWPILVYLFVRLARREEKEMEKKFGEAYLEYKRGVPMFFPFLRFTQHRGEGCRQ
jgi:protein-S-isoprenylcysteine O-methyltransferase Ste14